MNEQIQTQIERRLDFFTNLEKMTVGERTSLKRSIGLAFNQSSAKAWAAFYKAAPVYRPWEEDPYFFAACAFCFFSDSEGKTRPLVDCLRSMSVESTGIKSRLLALLDTPWDNSGFLLSKLGRILRMVHQKGYRIDVDGLLQDLLGWSHDSRFVQTRWARTFFGLHDENERDNKNVD